MEAYMKKSAVVVLMLVMFAAGSAFAGEACKNASKSSLLSSTNASSTSTSGSAVKGTR
jgi:hypothetical protein